MKWFYKFAGFLTAIALGPLSWPVAEACDSGTVRDAALMAERGVYRLCVFVKSDDAGASDEIKRIASRINDPAAKLNVQVERVDVDKPNVDWESYGIPSAPPETPVAALIGEGGMPKRAFVLDHWQPYPTDDELKAIQTSPAREKIKDGIASHWAVVLYSPGDPALGADSTLPDELFKEVETEWAEKQSPGVTTVRFDRADPAERMLRSFTGIEKEGPAWVGIVFGRGKVLAPPLTGGGITKENIGKLLEGLAVPCTCLQESSVLGLDIPMTWDARLDEVIASIKPAGGYFETMLDPAGQPAPVAAVPQPQPGRQVLGIAVAAAIALALVAVTATGVVVYRARRGTA